MRTALAALSLASLLILPASAHFSLTDEYVGRDFLQSWNWESMDDPTHGRVNYLSQTDALNGNLTYGESYVPLCRIFADHQQRRTRNSSCVPTLTTLSPPPRAGGTACASPHSGHTTRPSSFSTSATCRKVVAHGLPSGRSASVGPGLMAARLTSSKVSGRSSGSGVQILTGVNCVGVNQDKQNLASLHTTPGCTVLPPRSMTG